MNFIDNEAGGGDSEDDVLVPSSQTDDSVRPHKRRRITREESTQDATDEDEDYDLPSNKDIEQLDPDEIIYRSKYEEVTHIPQYATTQKDTFVTQLAQPWSSPTHIRGPRWQRPPSPPTPSAAQRQPPPVSDTTTQPTTTTMPPPVQPSNQQVLVGQRAAMSQHIVTGEDEYEDIDLSLFDQENLDDADSVDPARFAPVRTQPLGHSSQSFRQTTLFGTHTTHEATNSTQAGRSHNWPLANRNEKPTHHDIDTDAMKTWVYPTNLGTIRDYQYSIVHKGLYHNLLVALPTGLGKTFIAATVMLNWYRWTNVAQIVFIAPTKPLVAQQIEACFNIAGIPRSQTTLLTGEIPPAVRAEEWQEKRVFFMTPQTLINDLKSGIADPKKIVLLVVDEAHKATGNYAYVEVVRFMQRFTTSFRVLALTATPGSSVESVQQVIDGLGIARIEIRTEDSIDIRQYVHTRDENLERFDNSLEMQEMFELFRKAAQPLQNKLCSQNAYWNKDPVSNTLFGLKKAQDQWVASDAGRNAEWKIKAPLIKTFQVLMSLAHTVDLLKYHGIGPFFHKMKIFEDEAYGLGKYAKQIVDSSPFKEMMTRLRSWVNNPDFVGHPKLSYLKEVTLNHFMDAGEGRGAADGRPPSETRIMVFAHFRDSAEEIVRVLRKHEPMIRPHIFVGQSHTKGSEGMDQKMQQKIIQQFKAGTYNVLVATSIGEEGLDIGEVDLIVCYDASKSPIRMLQRMGRTGRKRAGNVHILLMRGKEEDDFARAKDNYRKMQELIESGREFRFHEDHSPRIVPKGIQPVVDKRVVEIPVENTQDASIEPKRRPKKNVKKPPKRFNMPDGVETGFSFLGPGKKPKKAQRAPVRLDDSDAAVPTIESVLLTTDEETERQTKYGEIPGTETQVIQMPQLDSNAGSMRRLAPTRLLGHSYITENIVTAYNKMRRPENDCLRPTTTRVKQLLRPILRSQLRRTPANCGSKVTKARTNKRKEPSTRLRSSETASPTIDDYAELGSFIDDDPVTDEEEPAQLTEATTPDTLLGSIERGTKASQHVPDEPFWVSQQYQDRDSNADEDLPDMEDIFASQKERQAVVPDRVRQQRRVMDSDDDDE